MIVRNALCKHLLLVGFSLLCCSSKSPGFCQDELKPRGERYTNSIGMSFVRVKPGSFRMGFDKKLNIEHLTMFHRDFLHDFNVRETTITSSFWLGEFEVTNEHFRKFVADTGYQTDNERLSRKYTWLDLGFPVADSEPVVAVSWNDAVRFCEWLSKKEGRIYRLPTEAEWEYSARAGTETLFSFGDDPSQMPKYGNIADQSLRESPPSKSKPNLGADSYSVQDDSFPYLAPVGSFLPNGFGLYDMHGNAYEYCRDRYFDTLDLADTIDPKGPMDGDDDYVIRGGSWNFGEMSATSFFRFYVPGDHGLNRAGFRVLLEEYPVNNLDSED